MNALSEGRLSVRSQIRQIRRPLSEDELSAKQGRSGGEQLSSLLERISLKDVPLDERRKEADKPLYLKRYE